MNAERYSAVRSYPLNEQGCDYVVGDIHGCFVQLQRRLDALSFDPHRDRLFSVGDLIDRGPDSLAALAWLRKRWFHCCLGNHEAMLLSLGEQWRAHPEWLLFNGGEWWYRVNDDQRRAFFQAVVELPFALEVDTRWGTVGIVHADVSPRMSWASFKAALMEGDEHARATALWSRARAEGQVRHGVDGVQRVVCGHTVSVDGRVTVRGNVWCIDTGAFLAREGDRLTVLPMGEMFDGMMASRRESY